MKSLLQVLSFLKISYEEIHHIKRLHCKGKWDLRDSVSRWHSFLSLLPACLGQNSLPSQRAQPLTSVGLCLYLHDWHPCSYILDGFPEYFDRFACISRSLGDKERVLLEYRRARENKIKAASFGEEGWWWLLLSACPYILLHSGLTVSGQEGRVGLLSLFSNLEKEVERYYRLFHLLLWLFVELTWSFFWTRMSSSDLPHRL